MAKTRDARRRLIMRNCPGITYGHMGLYGYERNTTPRLSLRSHDPEFVWKEGIAGAISNRVAFDSFWNSVRDPRNSLQFMQKTTNAFRRARENGFYNQFYSAQSSNLLRAAVARVPVMFFARNGDHKWRDAVTRWTTPPHYDMSSLILSMLGYTINDPNAKPNIYYINGLGYHHGENGYIRVENPQTAQSHAKFTVFFKS
jgi:hypothetical protein